MPKCSNNKCGKTFKVRDVKDYFLLKDKRGNQYRFDSLECLGQWVKEKESK